MTVGARQSLLQRFDAQQRQLERGGAVDSMNTLYQRAFDMLTPTNLSRQIFEEKNMAAAVLTGAFVIALAIIIAQAIA
jgi:uncharacterized membrane protein YjfL (UPF0719 family)